MSNEVVLYVNFANGSSTRLCRGSAECMKHIDRYVNVQNITDLIDQGIPLPQWLNGSPIAVDVASKQAHKGNDAVLFMRNRPRAMDTVRSNLPMGRGVGDVPAANTLRDAANSLKEATGPLTEATPDETDASDPFASIVSPEDMRECATDSREGKITEEDIQKIMQQRAQAYPGSS